MSREKQKKIISRSLDSSTPPDFSHLLSSALDCDDDNTFDVFCGDDDQDQDQDQGEVVELQHEEEKEKEKKNERGLTVVR